MKKTDNKDKLFEDNNITYFTIFNLETLHYLNTVIHGLYALNEQRFISHCLNTSSAVEKEVWENSGIDLFEWAMKLEKMRSLLFGETLNWKEVERQLKKLPDQSSVYEEVFEKGTVCTHKNCICYDERFKNKCRAGKDRIDYLNKCKNQPIEG